MLEMVAVLSDTIKTLPTQERKHQVIPIKENVCYMFKVQFAKNELSRFY
jgi:hypothetical protein